ncbi:hypothetical protein SPRG_05588 [Saprolegnia parasitica CBS 223.65]|uniref:Uncharacterized protein n=1 Tax=Saprolegnia parasitica (strain CBS 223.65) TaxID=695850 RepID=A0A067CKA9_SAPPC|nr:hypothetical protein SPRG_05588 [Saprolegnia parasitica CBS 223.65]KDO29635.1 hypothetical protein SPRG_05588 [Saprolegnia parasitica CBS 223.65]|eukprot:XP_012199695.1 hypothetical protein SPRG_05588 [Saprolegnia parasitica CBS 223.65]
MSMALRNPDLVRQIASYQYGVFEDIRPLFTAVLALKALHHTETTSRTSFMVALDAAMSPFVAPLQTGLLLRLVRCVRSRDFAFVMSCLVKHAIARGHVEILHNVHRRLSLHQCQHLALQAAAYGQLRVLKYLHAISYPRWGPTPLLAAVQCRDAGSVAFLQEQYPQACVCHALTAAAKAGDLPIVQTLYPHRHATNCVHDKAFDQAVSAGHVPVVAYLLERGETGSGIALALAADHGHLDLVRYLHMHVDDRSGPVVMDLAAASGHLAVVQYLHTHDVSGCTAVALREAAAYGHADVVAFLVAHRKEGNPLVAWRVARRHGHDDVASILEPSSDQLQYL